MRPQGFISMWGLALWGEAEWANGVLAPTSGEQPNVPSWTGGMSDTFSAGFNG